MRRMRGFFILVRYNARPPIRHMPMRRQDAPRENMNRWIAALQSGAPHAVAQLYDDAAAFLPTVSAQFLRGRAAAEAYFAGFLQTHRNCAVIEECVQWLGEDAYAHSGLYDFHRAGKDGKDAAARFTFVWRRTAGNWLIIHHHSSMKPGAA